MDWALLLSYHRCCLEKKERRKSSSELLEMWRAFVMEEGKGVGRERGGEGGIIREAKHSSSPFLPPSLSSALPQAPPSLLGPATLNLLAREEKVAELQPEKRGELLPLYEKLLTMLEKGTFFPPSLPPPSLFPPLLRTAALSPSLPPAFPCLSQSLPPSSLPPPQAMLLQATNKRRKREGRRRRRAGRRDGGRKGSRLTCPG